MFTDIGGQSSIISDGDIFQQRWLWQKNDTSPSEKEINVPYVFIGDEAFAFHKNIM